MIFTQHIPPPSEHNNSSLRVSVRVLLQPRQTSPRRSTFRERPSVSPFLFPSLRRAVCCHLTQTSTCLPLDRTAATQHCSSFYLTSADVTQHAHITARPSLRLFVRPLGRRPATTGSVRDLRQCHLSPRTPPPTPFDLLLLHPSFSPFLNLLRSLAPNPQRGRVQSVPQSKWLDIIMTLRCFAKKKKHLSLPFHLAGPLLWEWKSMFLWSSSRGAAAFFHATPPNGFCQKLRAISGSR